ncbi:MAG: MBL fold metallo-hydrolase [Candidatus Limimorpha sp.]
MTKEEVDFFTTDGGTAVYFYCIKHGTFKMRIGERWVYIDPVTDKIPPATDFSSQPKADLILITHEHRDHLDDTAIQQLSKKGTHIITNGRCAELLGRKAEIMVNGDKRTVFNWTIEAVPAYNYSADKQQFHPKGRDNGYIMTIDGLRIYIAGDTEDIDEMKDIKDIDVAFLPCNLPFTMTPEQTANAAKTIMPKVLFPYHYGETDIQQVVTLLQGTGIDVRIRQYH